MIYIIIFLCLLFFFLSINDTLNKKKGDALKKREKKNMLYLVMLVLFLVVLFRPSSLPDYKSYIQDFKYLDFYKDLRMELGSKFIIMILRFVYNHYLFVFAGFAAIGIPLKLTLLNKYSPFLFASLSVYCAGVLISQDMIAIRSSIAVGFFWWALYYKQQNNIKLYIILSGFAFLFHYSAIILFLFVLLDIKKIYRPLYFTVIPLAYLLVINGFNISNFFNTVNSEQFQALWTNYKYFDETDYYNIYNVFHLAKCLFFYFILFRIDTIKKYYPGAVVLMKVYCWSLVSSIILFESQSVSIRMSEFLCSVEVLLVPCLLFAYGEKHRIAMNFACLLYSLGLLANYGVLLGW